MRADLQDCQADAPARVAVGFSGPHYRAAACNVPPALVLAAGGSNVPRGRVKVTAAFAQVAQAKMAAEFDLVAPVRMTEEFVPIVRAGQARGPDKAAAVNSGGPAIAPAVPVRDPAAIGGVKTTAAIAPGDPAAVGTITRFTGARIG
jgi:hypothetical protein